MSPEKKGCDEYNINETPFRGRINKSKSLFAFHKQPGSLLLCVNARMRISEIGFRKFETPHDK